MASINTPAAIGDVVRALHRLKAGNAASAASIMQALGWRAMRAAPVAPEPPPRVIPHSRREAVSASAPKIERRVQSSELRPLSAAAAPVSAPRLTSLPLPLPPSGEHRPVFSLPIEPLFEPRLARAILGRMSAVRRRRGEVDVNAVVATIARGGLLTRVPRRPAPSVGSGLQVLIDIAPAMQPFFEDIGGLLGALRGAVGAERITVLDFETCPLYGVIDDATQLVVPYVPPRAGMPVLAVTDLGLARASASQRAPRMLAWRYLARRLATSRTPLSLLSPYSEERLGARALTRNIRFALWDRGVGVHRVPPAPFLSGPDD